MFAPCVPPGTERIQIRLDQIKVHFSMQAGLSVRESNTDQGGVIEQKETTDKKLCCLKKLD